MSNQARWLIAAHAVFHVGATLVPLDYKLSAAEQKALLEHCGADALIAEYGLADRFEERPNTFCIYSEPKRRAVLKENERDWDALPETESLPPRAEPKREDIATIVYSSGTGGRAKGCLLSHRAYLEQIDALMGLYPMRVGHRSFSILPTNHAIDFMVGFLGPFCAGATVVHQRLLRPETIRSTMRDYGITHMAIVPLILEGFEKSVRESIDDKPKLVRTMFDALGGLNELLTAKKPQRAISKRLLSPVHEAFGGKLEMLFCGGAYVDPERAEYFYRLGLPVAIGYGLTEACTVATLNDLRPFRGDTVGHAVPGVEIRIHCPDAEGVGEVWLRGKTLMSGYLDDPELTAETIDEDGWLHTGDLGWLDAAHHLHLVGRGKDMIVTAGGKNVYPQDIESAFSKLSAEEFVIFARNYLFAATGKGTLTGEGLVVVVRLSEDIPIMRTAAVNTLSEMNRRLPEHKRVGEVLFVKQEFPRTASMKVKRKQLAETLRADADEGSLMPLQRTPRRMEARAR